MHHSSNATGDKIKMINLSGLLQILLKLNSLKHYRFKIAGKVLAYILPTLFAR